MRKSGYYRALGELASFIPFTLPPKDPPLALDAEATVLYGQAMHELGKLNEIAHHVPGLKYLVKAYVIKEALLSSAIEGVHTTLIEVLTQPLLESRPKKNTQLVMNYTKALDVALSMIKEDGLPLVSRVILRAHEALMSNGEGDKADPGQYRKQAVTVGTLIPAPPDKVPDLMADLERYINVDQTLPPLIKAGLAHVQFETIHPFLDGNGRIGRLLIALMLVESGLIAEPILYLSYYFKKNRFEYYRLLDRVRTHGDFEAWITYYLTAIRDSSIDAHRRAKDIERLDQRFQELIMQQAQSEKSRDTRLLALSVLFVYPIITVSELSRQLGVSYNTASKIIADFVALGILVEENKQKRGKLFKFEAYLAALEREY